MRLFVSVDLPAAFAEPIAALQAAFEGASGLDFTDPEQAHVTLKFLGDTDPDRVEEITAALETAVEAADVAPFEATFEGLGVFPSMEYISVLWLGVGQGAEQFRTLQAPIEAGLIELGFEPETHDFTPHVTLARMKHAGGKELVQQLVSEREPTIGTTTVEAVSLTESRLTSEGPVYETVERVALDGAAGNGQRFKE
ncbi:RNA 2',3'-cyclic phosphodiesterase [Halodesulfurarchaeum sp. HSR-GB]|uniref:RNA 2',3'-cyclic phosphodiesterase n=1 Tax=Halodesulfurarchaeum sp. HSR-GB TaxID=3074077 RepID=UPI0028643591|nr:RNA 2',3'-cyclic phosphodiesterase [Halodesulfurarchaeum sp. HSR-GB]MDR5656191.1 RNA 2',3'-cyclic phosphodiesterase [Halodesulfurarchaeum sp. HSR-GB]